jgi:AcrR family transcriptional regulator
MSPFRDATSSVRNREDKNEADMADEVAPSAPPDRQPKRSRTRAILVRAGQKLFSERPIEVVSIDDIVQAASVAKGTFYNHFADKDEFEREILAEARRELEAAIQAAFGDERDPAIRMALAACVNVRFAHDYPDRALLIARQGIRGSQLQSDVNATMLADVSLGILSGRFSVSTAEIGGLVVLGLGNIGIVRTLELDNIFAKVTLGQQLASALLRSLGVPGEEASQIAARAAERLIRVPAPSDIQRPTRPTARRSKRT